MRWKVRGQITAEIRDFQFSIWDAMQNMRHVCRNKYDDFQFSIWDAAQRVATMAGCGSSCFQFSIWDAPQHISCTLAFPLDIFQFSIWDAISVWHSSLDMVRSFNSLFEMLRSSATYTSRGGTEPNLSILYLRCKGEGKKRNAVKSEAFNSLFEMRRLVWNRDGLLVDAETLSILYLRCWGFLC